VILWGEPGFVVGFTTRTGGASVGSFASLNLSAATGDAPENVAENRRRACVTLGLDPTLLASNRQVHSATVLEAAAGQRGSPADGLVTGETRLPLLAMAADCVPIAIVRTGRRRRLALLHAGWRGLAAGVVEAGAEAVGAGETAAIVGPAIGPCCYEVGPEVAELFDDDLTVDGKLDLWHAADRALRAAGVDRVERVDLCTRCNEQLFFSHRRDGARHGVQGAIGALA
jgi:polyphenol oxidase